MMGAGRGKGVVKEGLMGNKLQPSHVGYQSNGNCVLKQNIQSQV